MIRRTTVILMLLVQIRKAPTTALVIMGMEGMDSIVLVCFFFYLRKIIRYFQCNMFICHITPDQFLRICHVVETKSKTHFELSLGILFVTLCRQIHYAPAQVL